MFLGSYFTVGGIELAQPNRRMRRGVSHGFTTPYYETVPAGVQQPRSFLRADAHVPPETENLTRAGRDLKRTARTLTHTRVSVRYGRQNLKVVR